MKLALCCVALATLGITLYVFNPLDEEWMPRCLFFTLTGYKCPSCGALRAGHNLLHLNFREALSYNPLLPLMVILAGVIIYRLIFEKENFDRTTRMLIYCYVAIYFLWWLIRNLLGV